MAEEAFMKQTSENGRGSIYQTNIECRGSIYHTRMAEEIFIKHRENGGRSIYHTRMAEEALIKHTKHKQIQQFTINERPDKAVY